MNIPSEHLSVCELCGRTYINFCVHCAKQSREEMVEQLMDKYGLTVEQLVRDLTDQVAKENFGALRLAIEMRSMKPATKADVTSGGQPLVVDSNVKSRIASKLAKVLESDPED